MVLLSAMLLSGVVNRGEAQEAHSETPPAVIQYRLELKPLRDPRLLLVRLRIPVTEPTRPVRLQMPVWSPGDYHVQNHARYVQNLKARSLVLSEDGETIRQETPLRVSRPDDNTWQLAAPDSHLVEVSYELQESPSGYFTENISLKAKHAFLNGPSVYLYVVGRKKEPVQLEVVPPTSWQVETALDPLKDTRIGEAVPAPTSENPSAETSRWLYQADGYDTLADSPIVLAAPKEVITYDFKQDGKPHRVVFFNRAREITNPDGYVPMLQRIVATASKLMKGLPYRRYYFLLEVGGRGGSLEHLNSTRINLFPRESPENAADVCAHEYFHLWNVKRIRPAVLGPFDYIVPPRTVNLWFAEGVTDYYAALLVHRAGLSTERELYSILARSIAQLQNNPARLRVSAEESSWRVWEANNSTGFGGLSYYLKGRLIGLCLDLKIRAVTGGERSLDDVMRLLMARHGLPKTGYGEDGLREIINEVAKQDLSAFYHGLVRAPVEMPFAECLLPFGLAPDLTPLPNATPDQLALRQGWLSGNSSAP